ncbi:MAG: glucose-6-phosphate isomerase [Bacteroidales bacterium]|nr:glucose-6-phosphate isomerase [Bacteroidales bacterium]
MVKFEMGGCNSFIKDAEYKEYVGKALSALSVLEKETGSGNDFLGWKHLPSLTLASRLTDQCEVIRKDWLTRGVDLVVVIGIGGSYLGAKCAVEALSHTFGRSLSGKKVAPEIVFAGNNLSEDYLCEMMDLARERNVACVVISKSGTTTEPAVAFRIVKQYIEQRYGREEAAQRIVAVTDAKRGALKSLSDQEGYRSFVIEDNVGGRFSVLTPVGLLPIMLAGYDVKAMLKGALEMEQACARPAADNPAVQYAAMRNLLYDQGKKVEILVSFNPKLQYLGEWWKQLYGESEGKDGKGIFPASVICTTDLHSMGQYIQDGERILMETTVTVNASGRSLVIESDNQNLDGLNFLAGKHVEECNRMAQLGTQLAHIDGGVPQMNVSVDKLDEFNLGGLFYFFEKACGISAYILGVNPFNQPGVEAYKKNMFALLEKPGYEEQTKAIQERLKK